MTLPTADTDVTASRNREAVVIGVLPPLSALAETAVLFAGLLALDWLMPGVSIVDLKPHPFWLPVLLLSLQYGTVSGLIAAGVAIALTAKAGFPDQGTSETYFRYLVRIWLEPMLWIAAAVVFGQFRMRQLALKAELVRKVGMLSAQRGALSDYARNLRRHCDALERLIASRPQGDTVLLLQAMSRAHGSADSAGIFRDLMRHALPNAHASLYAADRQGLQLRAATASGEDRPVQLPASDPLYVALVGGGRSLTVLDRDGERYLAGHGLAAVPVLAHATAGSSRPPVIGMLKIEKLDPATLSVDLPEALSGLALAMAPLLERTDQPHPALTPIEAPLAPGPRKLWRHLRWLGGRPIEDDPMGGTVGSPAARQIER